MLQSWSVKTNQKKFQDLKYLLNYLLFLAIRKRAPLFNGNDVKINSVPYFVSTRKLCLPDSKNSTASVCLHLLISKGSTPSTAFLVLRRAIQRYGLDRARNFLWRSHFIKHVDFNSRSLLTVSVYNAKKKPNYDLYS